MTDIRPVNCRFRLQEKGKAYPRSSCPACGRTIATGLGNVCKAPQDLTQSPTDAPDTSTEAVEAIAGEWRSAGKVYGKVLGPEIERLADLLDALAAERDSYRKSENDLAKRAARAESDLEELQRNLHSRDDEMARLRAENERLREVLVNIAKHKPEFDYVEVLFGRLHPGSPYDRGRQEEAMRISGIARAALAEGGDDG